MATGNPPKGAHAAPLPFIVAPTKLNGIGSTLKVFCTPGQGQPTTRVALPGAEICRKKVLADPLAFGKYHSQSQPAKQE